MPSGASAPRLRARGSHQTTENSAGPEGFALSTCKPGQTVLVPAVLPPGRINTESFDLNSGQPRARICSRLAPLGGYTAVFSGWIQPSLSSSPTAGTTSRSRARVAATYATRVPSASSRSNSSSSCCSRSKGAQPARRIAHTRRSESMLRDAKDARSFAVMSASTTIGNSSPLALCTVISRTPSLPSSRIGASPASPLSACSRNSSIKPRNEMPP